MQKDTRKYSPWGWHKDADGIHRPEGKCTLCGELFRCENMGAASYCPACAAKVKREKTAERVRKYRERQNAEKQTRGAGQ